MKVIFLDDFAQKSRPRGRPAGKSQLTRVAGLCLHDLAFMRAVLQGIDLQVAAERFLPDAHVDLRVIRQRLVDTCAQAQSLLRGLGRLSDASTLGSCLATAAQIAGKTSTQPHQVPNLAEFAETLDDPDAWSESELLEIYLERHTAARSQNCASGKPSADLMEISLLALNMIQAQGVRLPKLNDELQSWTNSALSNRLNAAGLKDIGSLTQYINARGRHWYSAILGLGRERAARLVQWLQDHVNFLEPVLTNPMPAPHKNDLAVVGVSTGILRLEGSNALGVQTDHQAIQSWMTTLEFQSIHTRKAYTRDVSRFLLWSQTELHKSLSEITVMDAAAFARFLQNPPTHWCSQSHARSQGKLFTMQGGLSPSSCARTLAAIGHFYGFLVETKYLKANPFTRMRKPQDRGIQMDVQRCFSNAHLQLMQRTLDEMAETPKKRRIKAILALMESTGVRIGEIPASWAAVVEQFDAEHGAITCLKVMGKGGRERLVPLKQEVLYALRLHASDLPTQDLLNADRPLIGCIERAPGGKHQGNGALSTARLRAVLVAFFREVATRCDAPELAAEFQRATPHFMRHTFAHRVLQVTQQDLAVTQQLLGHKSISTTGIYVKANLSQRLNAIQALSIHTSKGATP